MLKDAAFYSCPPTTKQSILVTAVNECTRFGLTTYYHHVTESAAPAYATEKAKDATFCNLLRRRGERGEGNANPKFPYTQRVFFSLDDGTDFKNCHVRNSFS